MSQESGNALAGSSAQHLTRLKSAKLVEAVGHLSPLPSSLVFGTVHFLAAVWLTCPFFAGCRPEAVLTSYRSVSSTWPPATAWPSTFFQASSLSLKLHPLKGFIKSDPALLATVSVWLIPRNWAAAHSQRVIPELYSPGSIHTQGEGCTWGCSARGWESWGSL